MKYLTICFALFLIGCLFISQTNALFGKSDSKKATNKGKCSLYKGACSGLSGGCCKSPYICYKQTKICGKGKSCCVSEADIQRDKQESGNWLAGRSG